MTKLNYWVQCLLLKQTLHRHLPIAQLFAEEPKQEDDLIYRRTNFCLISLKYRFQGLNGLQGQWWRKIFHNLVVHIVNIHVCKVFLKDRQFVSSTQVLHWIRHIIWVKYSVSNSSPLSWYHSEHRRNSLISSVIRELSPGASTTDLIGLLFFGWPNCLQSAPTAT